MEVPRPVHLGPQDVGDLVGVERLDQAVVEDTGGVHHAGQRVFLWHGGEGGGEAVAVGDVAGDEAGTAP